MKKLLILAISVLFVLALFTACGTAPSSQMKMKAGYGEEFVSVPSQNQITSL